MRDLKRLLLLLIFLSGCADEKENLVVPSMENQFKYYTTSNGLISNEITTVYEAKGGDLWIGTPAGISVFDGQRFTNFDSSDGLIDGTILAISEDASGSIWVGSDAGYSVFDGQSWSSESSISLSALYLDENKTFWLGTNGSGLIRWDANGQITTYSSDLCEYCNYYSQIFPAKDGSVWFSTFGGALRFKNNGLDQLTTTESVDEFLLSGTCDENGTVWLGAYDLLFIQRYSKGNFSSVDVPVGYASVTGMQSRDKTLYVATYGGLFYYDGILFRQLRTPKEDVALNSILKDSNEVLWIGTSENGLLKLIPKDRI